MKWSWRLGRAAGVDIYLHITFLLLLGWQFFSRALRGDLAGAVSQGLIFNLVLFGTVVLHEFGHALAARHYGIGTADITLLPIGGVARLLDSPGSPKEELVIALAGPAVNVALAGLIFAVLQLVPGLAGLGLIGALFVRWLHINVALLLFNLIPAFPMDGGRVLRALLAMRMGFSSGTRIAARVGQVLAVGLIFAGLAWNPMLMLIGLFVWAAAAQEAALVG
jgi:Zn-dependent protease